MRSSTILPPFFWNFRRQNPPFFVTLAPPPGALEPNLGKMLMTRPPWFSQVQKLRKNEKIMPNSMIRATNCVIEYGIG